MSTAGTALLTHLHTPEGGVPTLGGRSDAAASSALRPVASAHTCSLPPHPALRSPPPHRSGFGTPHLSTTAQPPATPVLPCFLAYDLSPLESPSRPDLRGPCVCLYNTSSCHPQNTGLAIGALLALNKEWALSVCVCVSNEVITAAQ